MRIWNLMLRRRLRGDRLSCRGFLGRDGERAVGAVGGRMCTRLAPASALVAAAAVVEVGLFVILPILVFVDIHSCMVGVLDSCLLRTVWCVVLRGAP